MVTTSQSQDLVIEATGLTKTFRDFWGRPKARAVNNVDLMVRRGQVFGLLGPNGSGKSTTVKMILGLLYPSRGKLSVLSHSPRNVAIKKRIGYLPEETYLYKYLTATETLDFFGALFGIPAAERRKRTNQLLDMVGLGSARHRQVGEFSKGMARRIGLAQALVNDPDLVILDEPTSGLDPIGCREVKDLIRLLASRGKTVIMCSHLLADVEDVCDEVVVLYGGRIRAQGNLKEILSVEDRTRITSPALEPAVLQQVLAILREKNPDGDVTVDTPSMNLEEFFLDVVRQARAASIETAGAQSGGDIAAYLKGEAETVQVGERTEHILATLTQEESDLQSKEAAPPAEEPPKAAAEVLEAAEHKLEKLTGKEPAAREHRRSPEEDRATRQKNQSEALRQADSKLKNLLDKRGQGERD